MSSTLLFVCLALVRLYVFDVYVWALLKRCPQCSSPQCSTIGSYIHVPSYSGFCCAFLTSDGCSAVKIYMFILWLMGQPKITSHIVFLIIAPQFLWRNVSYWGNDVALRTVSYCYVVVAEAHCNLVHHYLGLGRSCPWWACLHVGCNPFCSSKCEKFLIVVGVCLHASGVNLLVNHHVLMSTFCYVLISVPDKCAVRWVHRQYMVCKIYGV